MPVEALQPGLEEVEVEIENDGEDEAQRAQKTLRALVAEGLRASDNKITSFKVKMGEVMKEADTEKMDLAILEARKRGDKSSLINALENKVKQLVSTCQKHL